MPSTKKGVYHNLRESEYVASNGEVTLFFSSELYLNKFLSQYENNRIIFLSKMAKLVVDSYLTMDILADITFYCKTEKRGFLAWLNGVKLNKEDLHKYALRLMLQKNEVKWIQIDRPKASQRFKIGV
ncbi:MAG TPA: early protein GP4 [Candidatus Saccharimonadales bacterium]|nr:early protein GP4 [Candidatus Saccharimonadales bacterium]